MVEINVKPSHVVGAVFGLYLVKKLIQTISSSARVFRDLDKKYVFVTGCDSGFGLMLCKRLENLGVRVFAGCYSEEGVKQIEELDSELLTPLQINITDPESVADAHDFVVDSLPAGSTLWGLVNNAGLSTSYSRFELSNRESWRSTFEVNVFGTMEVTQQFLHLIRQSKGRLVFMSSGSGAVAIPAMPVYSTSKFAVSGLADCLRRDMAEWGVKVSVLEPSFYKTNITDVERTMAMMRYEFDVSPPDVQEDYGYDWLRRGQEKIRNLFATANPNLDEVTDCYIHALFSADPKPHYMMGSLVKRFMRTVLSVVPYSFSDWFIIRAFSYGKPAAALS